MKRIGVDTGGTFTDSVLWDEEKGLVASAKASSNKADPAGAVLSAIGKLDDAAGGDVRYVVHGTTVATNATLERSGPRIGLISTAGFGDVLEIARLTRPPEEIYDLRASPQLPLIRRRDRLEIVERIDVHGGIITPLDEASVVEAAHLLRRRGISSIAVCLLHSYVNGAHEKSVRDILARELPGANISLSSEVLPEFREYERCSTTALNAYLAPIVSGYLRRLQHAVRGWSETARLWVMQSNGGVASTARAAQLPVTLLLSGPSGGVVAGRHLIEQARVPNGITIDMGGTSFDVCLLPDKSVPMTHERHVMNMPVKVPSVDILTIGAGGGSIGWVDAAGQFRVGPQSAGANPGPACYGRGGEEPTVTDANVVLGVLGSAQRLGGEVTLDTDLAYLSCERLGRKLGMGAIEVAWGIRRIVNAAMAGATRAVSVGRGYDPRDFSLIAFGGAGPMHAVDIAAELEIPSIIVPAVPGCLSALGLVVSDVTHDYVVTHLSPVSDQLESVLDRQFADLVRDAHDELASEGIEEKQHDLFPALDMRYIGEQFSVTVPLEGRDTAWLAATTTAFHSLHERLYGFSVPEEPVEVVNIRLRAIGRLQRAEHMPPLAAAHQARRAEVVATRQVCFGPGNDERCEVAVYARETLLPGTRFTGPAIVDQSDSTLLVPARRSVRADGYGNLLIGTAQT
jgi:N-methylhydantoinase A